MRGVSVSFRTPCPGQVVVVAVGPALWGVEPVSAAGSAWALSSLCGRVGAGHIGALVRCDCAAPLKLMEEY